LVGGHQADARMMMVSIVPAEKVTTEALGVLDAAECSATIKMRLARQSG